MHFQWKDDYHPSVPSDFEGLPYPPGDGYDHTFLQNDRKGWGNNYLNILQGESRYFVMETGTGQVPPPLVRRGLTSYPKAYPTPRGRWGGVWSSFFSFFFFLQNDLKGWSNNYLDL